MKYQIGDEFVNDKTPDKLVIVGIDEINQRYSFIRTGTHWPSHREEFMNEDEVNYLDPRWGWVPIYHQGIKNDIEDLINE